MLHRLLIAVLLSGFCVTAEGYPDLGQQFEIGGMTIVRDRETPTTFYYLPNDLEIPQREDGGPNLAFTVAVYTGTSVHGDRGERYIRSTFFSRLRRSRHASDAYDAAVEALRQRYGNQVVLREIPIASIDARILYSDVDGESQQAGEGFFEPTTGGQPRTLWQERDVFLSMDNATAQIVKRQLEQGSLGVSLTYSFYTQAWRGSDGDGELTGSGFDVEGLLEDETEETPPEPELIAIKADAVPIRIAEAFRDSRIREYHINESLPPDYASLVIYCFDFRDAEREDLFEKVILVEATGVAGGTTRHTAVFSDETPDVYARTVRFPFAVDLRQPYRWRVEEVLETGELQASEWQTSEAWTDVIDASGDVSTWSVDPEGEEL